MKKILFLHDTRLDTPRGAELTILQLMKLGEEKGLDTKADLLRNFEQTKMSIAAADLVIVNSTSRCPYEIELIQFLVDHNINYIKIEFDYNFCVRRNIYCTITKSVSKCCHNDKFHHFRELFKHAFRNIFQSPAHFKAHKEFYGEAIQNPIIMPPTVEVERLQISEKKLENIIPFFGSLNNLKGGNAYLDYAENHPEMEFHVYGNNQLEREIPENVQFFSPISNDEVLKILGQTKTFICQPVWPEPSGRLAAEAFLSGCEIISNNRVGTFSFDFYPNDPSRAYQEMKESPDLFFQAVGDFFSEKELEIHPKWKNVLIYKSYGGLGDIFFCIPSLLLFQNVAEKLSFAVESRLIPFFEKYFPQLKVVDAVEVKERESDFDCIIDLGNCPAFGGYAIPHVIRYPTHKKLKQHVIHHYIDGLARLHKEVQPEIYQRYPYISSKPKELAYTIHPGAGFLLKIWPTKKYAELIEKIHALFPELKCRIIIGPNDPNPVDFMKIPTDFIELVTGDLLAVGEAMETALFHIGNDAGITHVAGGFNLPTLAIYGPTGPGAWGSFSEINEIVWGKKGVCNLRCNYEVILNCEHRICLNSITSDRVLNHLFQLFNKMENLEAGNQILFGQNNSWKREKNDFILQKYDDEFLVEFHNQSEADYFETLLKQPFDFSEEFPDSIYQVLEVLIEKEIFFELPDFSNWKSENS
ncbi:glycosyltransferase family 9 protein [Moheibacter lacus]|uniref:ADP-heptose:LPS heptosyltransferase n=1 Tax=Moheibacter lacus TaxID=2745851 RepID=A0A838ZI00_9FLAO|nr:glycosyltransferase family 9 protein [Moheibacter lacus]MBA5629301.1 hypothetical protein [Moheibacter lacus]